MKEQEIVKMKFELGTAEPPPKSDLQRFFEFFEIGAKDDSDHPFECEIVGMPGRFYSRVAIGERVVIAVNLGFPVKVKDRRTEEVFIPVPVPVPMSDLFPSPEAAKKRPKKT